MAVRGRAGEGDTLDDPTATFEYRPFDWMNGVGPCCARARMREVHADPNSAWQEAWSYWDGFGREVLKKAQAEPGLAPQRDARGRVVRDASGSPVLVDTSPALRWIGTGRTVFNNKGEPVKQYEPFFSATPEFEAEDDLVAWGVSPLMHHDPVGRVVRVDLPDGTFTRVVFDPWQQASWDATDTVLESAWYSTRMALPSGDRERRAAELSGEHANTPAVTVLDAQGRAVRARADNGPQGVYETRSQLDVQGRTVAVTDARGIVCARYLYDLAGQLLRTESTDAGTSRGLQDVVGRVSRGWSARDFATRVVYDASGRPTHLFVTPPGQSEQLETRTVYGEGADDAMARQLRGRAYQQYDGAGVVIQDAYDFKGRATSVRRRFTRDYTAAADWSSLLPFDHLAELESKADALLEAESFLTVTEFDALDRPTRVVSHDHSDARPQYNEAGLFTGLSIFLRGASTATCFVQDVDYDAKGRRERIVYGNGVETRYSYDPQTFRLTRLKSVRNAGTETLQNLQYTFDADGNIVEIGDTADQPLLFSGGVVGAGARYEYDALARLVKAEGREHPGTVGEVAYGPFGDGRSGHAHPNDGSALRRYSEQYDYDAVGNILRVLHQAGSASWSRRYAYATGSNRLRATSLPGDPVTGPYTATYDHDAAGNMTRMPHLAAMAWTHDEHLARVDLGGGGVAYYGYDAGGQRVRKVIERSAGVREARLYPGGPEVFRKWSGGALERERQTLRVMDDTRAIAEVDTLTVDAGAAVGSAVPRARFQLDNHLGSASLELDASAAIIAYEEYFPYGASAYEARVSGEVPERRYRYTGMERDEESGLQRHGVRYYAPWLGRWTSADPAGLVDGTNVYAYVRNDPLVHSDPTGLWGWREVAVVAAVVLVGTVVTIATAGAAAPLIAGAVASVGLSGAAATVATGVAVGAVAGAVGGAVAGAAGEGTRQAVHGESLNLRRIGSAAARGAVEGAVIGGAIGGVAAAAATAAGAAAIGAVGRAVQRVGATSVGRGVAASGRVIASGARAAARLPGVRQVVSGGGSLGRAAGRGLQALERSAQDAGIGAARRVFAAGGRGAEAAERFAATRSVAGTFSVSPNSESAVAPATTSPAAEQIVTSGGAANRAQFERLKADLAQQELLSAEPVGSALKGAGPFSPGTFGRNIDLSHAAPTFARDMVSEGQMFTIRGGDSVHRNLTQVAGEVNGKPGIFEYIVGPEGLTHQRFIAGGRITGYPNQ
jgi:RHS repeat-associated protein